GTRYRVGARAGSRRGYSEETAEAHFQSLLSRSGTRPEAHQGHWPRAVHRAIDRARARRTRVRAERRRGPGCDVHPRAAAIDDVGMSRILIVEDEQHISDGLRFNLEAEGHEAVVVPDGEQALHLLLEERRAFDVIVLDVMLPGKDGFTVAADLRAAEQFVPILMLTARGRPEDVLRGFEAGADDYLPKPFELAILIARVNGLLRRRRWNEHGAAAPDVDTFT